MYQSKTGLLKVYLNTYKNELIEYDNITFIDVNYNDKFVFMKTNKPSRIFIKQDQIKMIVVMDIEETPAPAPEPETE